MRSLLLAVLVLGAPFVVSAASAETKPESTAAQSKECKKVIVGKGADKKVVCEIQTEITVGEKAPKPAVLIVNKGGKEVVGRPKSGDRLQGLSQRRRQ
jgi:hypothetical protein